jgi:hypothetical protein
MASFTIVIEISRPAQEVFAFLADLENVPKWNYAITKTRKTSPSEVGVGTTFEQTRSIPTPSREHLTITDFHPDRQWPSKARWAAGHRTDPAQPLKVETPVGTTQVRGHVPARYGAWPALAPRRARRRHGLGGRRRPAERHSVDRVLPRCGARCAPARLVDARVLTRGRAEG